MKKIPTPFPDVWLIVPQVFHDDRGFIYESFSYQKFDSLGLNATFVQDNHARSSQNTLRGLHFQLPPGQTKLVRCTKGKIWDVIVDIRQHSSTFKRWWGVELSDSNFYQIWIPVGYAHGYSVLTDIVEVEYKVSNYYDPKLEKGIYWNDPALGIQWKNTSPILSKRDQENPLLNDFLAAFPNLFV